jgi:hypothetical protein
LRTTNTTDVFSLFAPVDHSRQERNERVMQRMSLNTDILHMAVKMANAHFVGQVHADVLKDFVAKTYELLTAGTTYAKTAIDVALELTVVKENTMKVRSLIFLPGAPAQAAKKLFFFFSLENFFFFSRLTACR